MMLGLWTCSSDWERLTGHALDQVLQRPEGDVGANVLLHAVGVSSPLAQVTAFTASQVQHPQASIGRVLAGLRNELTT